MISTDETYLSHFIGNSGGSGQHLSESGGTPLTSYNKTLNLTRGTSLSARQGRSSPHHNSWRPSRVRMATITPGTRGIAPVGLAESFDRTRDVARHHLGHEARTTHLPRGLTVLSHTRCINLLCPQWRACLSANTSFSSLDAPAALPLLNTLWRSRSGMSILLTGGVCSPPPHPPLSPPIPRGRPMQLVSAPSYPCPLPVNAIIPVWEDIDYSSKEAVVRARSSAI